MASSPYINHFIQPDTIIPNPANPQSLNRYVYVNNNPIRYTDPTGHSPIDEPCGYQGQDCGSPLPPPPTSPPRIPSSGGGNSGGGDPYDEDNDGIPDIPNPYIILYPLATSARYPCETENTYVECLYTRAPLVINGDLIIDPDEFEKMLMTLFFDLLNRDTTSSNLREKLANGFARHKYDTPFWNGYGLFSGNACINGRCSERQEVNYVAQGMWSVDDCQCFRQ